MLFFLDNDVTLTESVSRAPDDALNLIRFKIIGVLSTVFAVVKHQTAHWKMNLKKKIFAAIFSLSWLKENTFSLKDENPALLFSGIITCR